MSYLVSTLVLLLLIMDITLCNPIIDTSNIVTVYFQGNSCSRHQAAKYAGSAGLYIIISEDLPCEHIFIPGSPQLLYNIFPYKDLNDIGYESSLNPLHMFTKAINYAKNLYFDIHGSNSIPHNYITEYNIAGLQDVTQYVNAIKECITENPSKNIVLFGTSRGASTVLISLLYLSEEEQKHIKLVLVEAPFDSVSSVIETTTHFPSLILSLLESITKYKHNQESPLDAVRHPSFPMDIPIAFITSEVDTTVPKENTMNLIRELRQKNHPHLHHLELKYSHHSLMSLNHEDDVREYYDFVHKLYNIYIQ